MKVAKSVPESNESPAAEVDINTWLAEAAEVCERAAHGDLEARLLRVSEVPGDLGRLLRAVNGLLDVTDAFVRESRAALEHAAAGKFYRRVLLRGMPGTFRSASRIINAGTEEMAAKAQLLAVSDKARLALADEFEASVHEVVVTIASSSTELRTTAEHLAHSARLATERAETVASASQETSGNVQSVASATEELNCTASEIGRQVEEQAKFATEAARATNDAASEVVLAADELSRQAEALQVTAQRFLSSVRGQARVA